MDDDEYRKGDQKQYYAVRVPIQRKLAVCVGLGAMTDDDRIGPSSAFAAWLKSCLTAVSCSVGSRRTITASPRAVCLGGGGGCAWLFPPESKSFRHSLPSCS
jgi:hypothetical protein